MLGGVATLPTSEGCTGNGIGIGIGITSVARGAIDRGRASIM